MDKIELIKQHLDAYTAGRWEEYRARLAPDVTYEEIGTRTTAKGSDEYLATVMRWKKAFPDLEARVRDVLVAGDKVMAEIEWKGTHTGPFDGPFGMIGPTNQIGSLQAVLMYRIADDKIIATRHYFDVLTVLTQLGAVPTMVAPIAPPKTRPAEKH